MAGLLGKILCVCALALSGNTPIYNGYFCLLYVVVFTLYIFID